MKKEFEKYKKYDLSILVLNSAYIFAIKKMKMQLYKRE